MKRRDLIEIIEDCHAAMQAVIENWSEGDLAQAVNGLDGPIEACAQAIAWWESDE